LNNTLFPQAGGVIADGSYLFPLRLSAMAGNAQAVRTLVRSNSATYQTLISGKLP